MRVTLVLIIVLFVVGIACGEEQVLFRMRDPVRDDLGSGKLSYPEHEVFVPGLFDLREFSVSWDSEYLYFDFKFSVITNPFAAPEGFFHQRVEVYLVLEYPGGIEDIAIGKHSFQTAPGFGWEARLSIAPFNESFLEISKPNGVLYRNGIQVYVSENRPGTIRVQLDRRLLPEPERTWRYYVLVGSFDGLQEGFWRGFAEDSWGIAGTGPPVFDLLAPRWGFRTQKRQLESGTLYPVGPGWGIGLPWLKILLLTAVCAGILFWGIYLWRWFNVRT